MTERPTLSKLNASSKVNTYSPMFSNPFCWAASARTIMASSLEWFSFFERLDRNARGPEGEGGEPNKQIGGSVSFNFSHIFIAIGHCPPEMSSGREGTERGVKTD